MSRQERLRQLLLQQAAEYPRALAQDFLKLLYQNEFGPGHMISDSLVSLKRVEDESAALACASGAPRAPDSYVQPIGGGFCRLSLCAVRDGVLSAGTLNRLFELSAMRPCGSVEGFLQKVEVLEELCESGKLALDAKDVREAVERWQADGSQPFGHSGQYRASYAPSYRVVEQRFGFFLPLFCRIDELRREKQRVVVAIDGRCASGKTTLAALLRLVYGCPALAMDHFFLRPEQRTQTRLEQAGGNVDYERFLTEALLKLLDGEPFSYRPFSCARGELAEPVEIKPCAVNIVEGSYSMHPTLIDKYDLRVFLTVPPDVQLRRIQARNGDEMLQRFRDVWIPLEEKYFSEFDVKNKCELVFCTE